MELDRLQAKERRIFQAVSWVQARRLYGEKISIRRAAHRFNVSKSTVHRRLQQIRAVRRNNKFDISFIVHNYDVSNPNTS